MPCRARAMPRPCRSESDFSRPRYSAAWARHGKCELASAVHRQQVGMVTPSSVQRSKSNFSYWNILAFMYVPLSVFCVLFVCKCVLYCCHRVLTKCVLYCCHRVSTKCVLYCCHRVSTQLQLKVHNNNKNNINNMLPLEGVMVDEKVKGNVGRKCILRSKRMRSVQL
jgi:hypothetical protein